MSFIPNLYSEKLTLLGNYRLFSKTASNLWAKILKSLWNDILIFRRSHFARVPSLIQYFIRNRQGHPSVTKTIGICLAHVYHDGIGVENLFLTF